MEGTNAQLEVDAKVRGFNISRAVENVIAAFQREFPMKLLQ